MNNDKEVLQIVLGLKLELLNDTPVKHNSYIPQLSKEDESATDLEIQKLLAKGVITKFEHKTGEYISPIRGVTRGGRGVEVSPALFQDIKKSALILGQNTIIRFIYRFNFSFKMLL